MIAYEKERHAARYSAFAEHGVAFLGMVNKRGRITGLPNHSLELNDRKKEMFFMSSALINNMCQDFDDDFGPLECCVVVRKDRKFLSIPTAVGIMLCEMPKDMDHESFLEDLRDVLKNESECGAELCAA